MDQFFETVPQVVNLESSSATLTCSTEFIFHTYYFKIELSIRRNNLRISGGGGAEFVSCTVKPVHIVVQ